MNVGANIYYKRSKLGRRRLKDYKTDWIGTTHRFFGNMNYGYLYSYPDSRFPNWTKEDFIKLAEKSTNLGFYLVGMLFLDIASTEGLLKALTVLGILLAGNEAYAYLESGDDDYYMLSGSSGVYGGLAGYCLAKYGVFPFRRHGASSGAVGFAHANFIGYNFLRFYMKDKTSSEEGGSPEGNLDHTIHFGTMAGGALLQKLL